MKVSTGTIARTACLIVALANQILQIAGKNVLPFAGSEVYEGVSMLLTTVASLVAWWKNNSFTKGAILADRLREKEIAGNSLAVTK